MSKQIRVGRGKASVTISGVLAEGLDREIREALGPVGETLQAQADAIMANARASWPVFTGKSRDGFGSFLRVHPGEMLVEVFIENEHDYTRYIRSTKVGAKPNAQRVAYPLETLLRRPVRESKAQRLVELRDVLVKAVQGAING